MEPLICQYLTQNCAPRTASAPDLKCILQKDMIWNDNCLFFAFFFFFFQSKLLILCPVATQTECDLFLNEAHEDVLRFNLSKRL